MNGRLNNGHQEEKVCGKNFLLINSGDGVLDPFLRLAWKLETVCSQKVKMNFLEISKIIIISVHPKPLTELGLDL